MADVEMPDASVAEVKAVLRAKLSEQQLEIFQDEDYRRLANNGFLVAQSFEAATREDLRVALPNRAALVAVLLKAFAPVPSGVLTGGSVSWPVQPSGVGGSGLNWAEVLKLSREELEFLDGFLRKEYPLPEMVTDVTRVPVFGGMPSMLLFDLGRKDFTHADDFERLLDCARARLQRVAVVAGTSGCGKTRSLYDLFSRTDGFYFVVSTEMNGGSNDLSAMIANSRPFLTREDRTGGNWEVVGVFTLLLLACRMVIYQHCKMKGANSHQWLLLQVACRGIRPGQDIFLKLFERTTKSLPRDRDGIRSELHRLQLALKDLSGSRPFPTVAIDEVQEAMKLMPDSYFWSISRQSWFPFANPLLQHLKAGDLFEHSVLVTGTGYALHYERAVFAGSGEKMVTASEPFTGFSGWDEPSQMEQFAQRVLKLSEEDLTLLSTKTWGIFPRFRGRFRPFCDVLQCMLAKHMTLAEASAYVTAAQATKEGKPEFPKSFYRRVAEVSTWGKKNGVDLLSELRRAVDQYFGFGRGWCVGPVWHETALEAGIGRIVVDGYAAEIEEFLILLAARNYFEDQFEEEGGVREDYLAGRLFNILAESPYPSAQGFFYQNFAAAAFEAMWKKAGGKMVAMPLFRPLLDCPDCPNEFRELASLQGDLREGLITVYVHSDRYTLEMYLADMLENRQMCTTFVCEDKYGADAMRAVEYPSATGEESKLIYFFDQHKLRKDPLSSSEMADALKKSIITDPDLRRQCRGFQVRVLYICPQRRQDLPIATWDRGLGTIIVDSQNASQVLGEEAARHIEVLKEKGGPMNLEATYSRWMEHEMEDQAQRRRRRLDQSPWMEHEMEDQTRRRRRREHEMEDQTRRWRQRLDPSPRR